MNLLAVIPARGGSKRLPRKNIIEFLGKPIIAHTIEAAVKTSLFKKIVVSSEDEEILSITGQYAVEVQTRPTELATDTAKVDEVCHHVLQTEIDKGNNYDILCCLYATAPLRNADDITKTVALVSEGKCNAAFAVTDYYYPPHQALLQNRGGYLEPAWPDMADMQSQQVPKLFIDNGSTYVVTVREFLRVRSFRTRRVLGHFMPRERSVDIDTMEDLQLARLYAAGGRE